MASWCARNGTWRATWRAGGLQIVLPQYRLPSADLFVYYLNRRNQPARVRAFIDFLAEHLRQPTGAA